MENKQILMIFNDTNCVVQMFFQLVPLLLVYDGETTLLEMNGGMNV